MLLLLTFLFFLLAFLGLSAGVLAGRHPLRGSCGGSGCATCRGSCRDRTRGTTAEEDFGDDI